MANFLNKVFCKSSQNMAEVPDGSIDLVLTSPPYFNIKDYAKNGYQSQKHSNTNNGDLGAIDNYENFIAQLLKVWKECERVLRPNGKLVINTPLMPMKKADYDSHYNRHIYDLNADIQNSILKGIKNVFLLDLYIWNRTNATKNLMFGSYPYPSNFYAQNTSEFVTVYVKDGISTRKPTQEIKEKSKLTEKEWVEFTKQIWDIPIPNKKDLAFGKHSALMPEEIVRRCVRLFTFANDVVLDPFTGSGTTLKVAKELNRNYVGYEIYENYKSIINAKLNSTDDIFNSAPQNTTSKKHNNLDIIKDKITYSINEDEYGFLDYEITNNILVIKNLCVTAKRKKIGTNLLKELNDIGVYYEVDKVIINATPNKETLLFLLSSNFEFVNNNDFNKLLEITKSNNETKIFEINGGTMPMFKKINL